MMQKPPNRIQELRTAKGLSRAAVAKVADTFQQQIEKLEKGERRLTTDWMERIAPALDCQPYELMNLKVSAQNADNLLANKTIDAPVPKDHDYNVELPQSPLTLPPSSTLSWDLPVYGAASAGAGDFFEMQDVVEYLPRPSNLPKQTGVYGLYVVGDSMAPRYENGEKIFIHPGRTPAIGDDVVVQISNGDEVTKALLKRLAKKDGKRIVLQSLNPDYSQAVVIMMEDIEAIHYVLKRHETVG